MDLPNGSLVLNTTNPIISYSNSGSFDVTLQVTDAIDNDSSFSTLSCNWYSKHPNLRGVWNYILYSITLVIYNPSGPGFGFNSIQTGSKCQINNSQGTIGSIDELIIGTIDLSNSAAASYHLSMLCKTK